MEELLDIYLEFFKMGSVTFGGGYAMLPILRKTCVEKKAWVTEEEVMDFYAVSQGLPGIIAVNVSVFIGYHLRQIKGGVAAALGCVSPCILIISLIAALLSNFQENLYVRHAMAGVSVCVVALILEAVLGLWKKGVKDALGLCLCAAAFLLSAFTPVSPVVTIVGAGTVGILVKNAQARQKADGGNEG